MSELSKQVENTISLAERRVFSPSFKPLYDDGMRLVEEAPSTSTDPDGLTPRDCRA